MRLPTCTCLLLVATATLASGPALATKVYTWKDANGVTHSSDQPPPDRRYEVRRVAGSGYAVEAPQQAQPAPAENPSCTTARQNLALLGRDVAVQQDLDGDGKPDRTLSPEEREAQKNLADAAVKAYCTPAS